MLATSLRRFWVLGTGYWVLVMLSRIAESLYWIGRYIERAEDTARIVDVTYHHTLGMGLSEVEAVKRRAHWEMLVQIAGEPAAFTARYLEANDDTVPLYLSFDTLNANSIVSCVAKARELARAMRHQIASEMWESLNSFYLDLQRHRASVPITGAPAVNRNAHLFYQSVKQFSHLFQGITDSTLPRDEGWHFLQAGKFLERASKTTRSLNLRYAMLSADLLMPGPTGEPVPGDWRQWQALLRSFSGYEAYHKLYRTAVHPPSIVDLVLLSPVFPRSIRFSVQEVDRALTSILGLPIVQSDDAGWSPGREHDAQRSTGRLLSMLAFARTDEIIETGLSGVLLDLESRCHQIGDQVHAGFFAPRIMRAEDVVA